MIKILNSVFIQPTFSCALNCKGCYVKESVQEKQMPGELLNSAIRYLWISTRFIVNQITLAVDDLPDDPEMKNIMIGALREVLRLKSVYGKKIELHLTMNSMTTLARYVDSGVPLLYITGADMISFSHLSEQDIPELDHVRNLTRLNYNFIPGGPMDNYRKLLNHVDMSYFVLFKTGLGMMNDPRAITKFKESVAHMTTWSGEERRKIIIDSCVRDAVNYKATGFGCSANISRLHIWPDGHVTGCPYNKNGGKPARNMTGIIDNIEEALGQYEFRSCTIPRDYLSPKPTLRVIQ